MTRLVPLGEAAFRFDLPADLDRSATLAALRAIPGVGDAALGEVHGAVYVDVGGRGPPGGEGDVASHPGRGLTPLERDVAAALVRGSAHPAREVRIRVVYDGPDLARVAGWAGLAEAEVVALHATRYTVSYLGFLPGFAYLGDVDPRIAAPRLPAPRPRVPAGAVGIAGVRTGVYPFASPGGWNLVGRVVDFVAFDAERGAALRAGDVVWLERA